MEKYPPLNDSNLSEKVLIRRIAFIQLWALTVENVRFFLLEYNRLGTKFCYLIIYRRKLYES